MEWQHGCCHVSRRSRPYPHKEPRCRQRRSIQSGESMRGYLRIQIRQLFVEHACNWWNYCPGDQKTGIPQAIPKSIVRAIRQEDITQGTARRNSIWEKSFEVTVGQNLDESVCGIMRVYLTQVTSAPFTELACYFYTLTNIANKSLRTNDLSKCMAMRSPSRQARTSGYSVETSYNNNIKDNPVRQDFDNAVLNSQRKSSAEFAFDERQDFVLLCLFVESALSYAVWIWVETGSYSTGENK